MRARFGVVPLLARGDAELVQGRALRSAVAGLARQVARHNVTINGLLPGAFLTDRLRSGIAETARKTNRPADEVIAERARSIPTGGPARTTSSMPRYWMNISTSTPNDRNG